MTPLLGILALVGVAILLGTILKFFRRKGKTKEEEERAKLIEEGIACGHLTKDGLAACVICGGTATENAPMTGLSWLDNLSPLSRLFALPPRYVVMDAEGRGYEYCKIHKDVAGAKLEQFHGLLRAERGQFNAMQAEKVAKMDGGGLQVGVQRYHNEVVEHLTATLEDTDRVRHLLPVSAQSDHTAVSTLSSTPKPEDPLDFSDVS
jgi:hypothetical protein